MKNILEYDNENPVEYVYNQYKKIKSNTNKKKPKGAKKYVLKNTPSGLVLYCDKKTYYKHTRDSLVLDPLSKKKTFRVTYKTHDNTIGEIANRYSKQTDLFYDRAQENITGYSNLVNTIYNKQGNIYAPVLTNYLHDVQWDFYGTVRIAKFFGFNGYNYQTFADSLIKDIKTKYKIEYSHSIENFKSKTGDAHIHFYLKTTPKAKKTKKLTKGGVEALIKKHLSALQVSRSNSLISKYEPDRSKTYNFKEDFDVYRKIKPCINQNKTALNSLKTFGKNGEYRIQSDFNTCELFAKNGSIAKYKCFVSLPLQFLFASLCATLGIVESDLYSILGAFRRGIEIVVKDFSEYKELIPSKINSYFPCQYSNSSPSIIRVNLPVIITNVNSLSPP